jgi:hypothetical protein
LYNTRYHIASLLAVFLALALGLVLGGLVVRQGTFDNQQAALVRGLRSEFKSLSTENRDLKQRDDLYSAFSANMTDAWVQGRLAGKAVVIMVNPGHVNGLTFANAAIESAGGQVVLVTLQKPGLALADKTVADALPGLTGTSEEQLRSVAASLAAEWAAPLQERPVTQALMDSKAISVEGLAPGMSISGLIDMATFSGKPDEGGLAVVEAFSAANVPAMVAQAPSTQPGIAVTAAERRLSAVDSLGLEPGRYSVIVLLTGGKPGYYGVGDGVDAAYAPLPGK